MYTLSPEFTELTKLTVLTSSLSGLGTKTAIFRANVWACGLFSDRTTKSVISWFFTKVSDFFSLCGILIMCQGRRAGLHSLRGTVENG